MESSKRKSALAFCLGIILVGCLIQAAGWMKGDRLVFPDVPDILRAFFRLLTSGKTPRLLATTLRHLALVMLTSTLIGLAVGLAEGFSDFVRSLLRPLMILMRSIPMIVLVVIVMVLAPYRHVPLIASTLLLIPLISEAVSEGIRHIEPEWIDVYRMNSRFNLRVLWHVHLPLMAGYLWQAYVNAVGMGVRLVVSTEYLVQTRDSLGKAIYSSAYFNEYPDIYAYALIMILLVLAVSELPVAIVRLAGRLSRARQITPDE